MRENLMSGSMWQGMGNLNMAMVLRHSQKKWRETGLPCLSLRHHPLTLPKIWPSIAFRNAVATGIGKQTSTTASCGRSQADAFTKPINFGKARDGLSGAIDFQNKIC
jgi:hypothetical protein